MSQTSATEKVIERLKKEDILVLEPKEPTYKEYEKSIVTSNLLYRFTRPPCVLKPKTTQQVQKIVQQARAANIPLTIRCGGHSYAGHSTATEKNTLLLDLRNMNEARLEMRSKTITVGAGCQWGEVYRTLIEGGHDGWVINGGRCPYVGVGGYILGGGLAPFGRSFGMGSDTLLEATIVTADGKVEVVGEKDKKDSKEGRLFWALRGAGSGNFGVVTEMKLKVMPLSTRNSGRVMGGRFTWAFGVVKNKADGSPKSAEENARDEAETTTQLLSTMNKFYRTEWPDRLTMDSMWVCDLRTNAPDTVRFNVCFDGSPKEFEKLIDDNIDTKDVAKELKRRVLPEPSTRFLYETLEAQWYDESKKFFAEDKTYRIFTSFCFDRTTISNKVDQLTAKCKERMAAFRNKFTGEMVQMDITWIHAGGQTSKVKATDTAFYWRDTIYHCYVEVLWKDKWMEKAMRRFMYKLKEEFRPFSLQSEAAFINFPDRNLDPNEYERAYFGENRHELRRIKQLWDKDNYFKWQQQVKLPEDVTEKGGNVNGPTDEDDTDTVASNQWAPYLWKHQESEDAGAVLAELWDMES
ncbi:hypothetical protein E8E13_008630 [Curvularia kusanoi]|uniref:FAD-binding PCMH-type domain-containing protein n=1 Tax=Curvularia kusanoi TaxID=90978 RepID=A0A9P4TE79_CURKU|nr:hypothetical protein E8E13_008630 [Curvularia kusanoi]